VTALAGFYVGEQYHVLWTEVPVPQELQMRLFQFAELALGHFTHHLSVSIKEWSISWSYFNNFAPSFGGYV
jgi:hypothetical protein